MASPEDKLEEYRREDTRLRSRIRALNSEIQALEADLALNSAKMAGFSEALDLIRPSSAEVRIRKRARPLSSHWQQIMQLVDDIDGEFSYEDLEDAAVQIDHEVGRDTLRSQMSLYRSSGLVEQGDEVGTFRLTKEGRKAAGIPDRPSTAPMAQVHAGPPPAGANRYVVNHSVWSSAGSPSETVSAPRPWPSPPEARIIQPNLPGVAPAVDAFADPFAPAATNAARIALAVSAINTPALAAPSLPGGPLRYHGCGSDEKQPLTWPGQSKKLGDAE